MKHNATITKNKVVMDDPIAWAVDKSKLEGQRCTIVLDKFRKKRSLNQNNYTWGILYKLIADNMGYKENEMDDVVYIVKVAVGHCVEKVVNGKVYVVALPTKGMTTVAYEEYLSKVRSWASAELGQYIPLPNEC